MGIVYRVRCHKILIYLPIELHRFDSCQRPKVAFFEAVNSWLGLINVYKFTTLDNFHLQRPKPFVYIITDAEILRDGNSSRMSDSIQFSHLFIVR